MKHKYFKITMISGQTHFVPVEAFNGKTLKQVYESLKDHRGLVIEDNKMDKRIVLYINYIESIEEVENNLLYKEK